MPAGGLPPEIPSGRQLQKARGECFAPIMKGHVENHLKSDLVPEISGIKGVCDYQTRGRVRDLPKGHLALGPGGECFAPHSPNEDLMI